MGWRSAWGLSELWPSLRSSLLSSTLIKAVRAMRLPILKEQGQSRGTPSFKGCSVEGRLVSYLHVLPGQGAAARQLHGEAWERAEAPAGRGRADLQGTFSPFSPVLLVLCSLRLPRNAGNCQDLYGWQGAVCVRSVQQSGRVCKVSVPCSSQEELRGAKKHTQQAFKWGKFKTPI